MWAHEANVAENPETNANEVVVIVGAKVIVTEGEGKSE